MKCVGGSAEFQFDRLTQLIPGEKFSDVDKIYSPKLDEVRGSASVVKPHLFAVF
jgi:hypothetical protein